jgi:hypothetical protein
MAVEVSFATREPGFAALRISVSPEIEGRSRDSEGVASRLDLANLLRVLLDSLLAPDFSLIFGRPDPLYHHHGRVSDWICNFRV